MRKTALIMFTALSLGAPLIAPASAQTPPAPAQPPMGQTMPMPDGKPPMMPHGGAMHGPMDAHHMGEHGMRHGGMDPRAFGLMYRTDDRKLAPDEVRKIAEAFLLWHGNRAWKVVEVAPSGDAAVGFAIATAEGSVIARFTMDRKTGKVTRVG